MIQAGMRKKESAGEMADLKNILIQLDTDPHPSVFDRVVAVDAGAEEIFSYGSVTSADVQAIVHGAIFTRGPKDLKRTALFIGGSDVQASEALLAEARKHMLPEYGLRTSILFDANGCNTTAVAAVRAVTDHMALGVSSALVLGGTGPVGQRAALLLAGQGAKVRLGSRKLERAEAACQAIRNRAQNAQLEPVATGTEEELRHAIKDQDLVVAAGAAGVVLLPLAVREQCKSLKVAIDLNAVPPYGIEGTQPTDKATDRNGTVLYGAIGIGSSKMKIHKAAVARLFETNDNVLDAEEIYGLAQSL